MKKKTVFWGTPLGLAISARWQCGTVFSTIVYKTLRTISEAPRYLPRKRADEERRRCQDQRKALESSVLSRGIPHPGQLAPLQLRYFPEKEITCFVNGVNLQTFPLGLQRWEGKKLDPSINDIGADKRSTIIAFYYSLNLTFTWTSSI